MKALYALSLVGLLSACSTQAWYEGSRQSALNECNKIVDSTERQRCIQDIPSYQQYEQQRKALK